MTEAVLRWIPFLDYALSYYDAARALTELALAGSPYPKRSLMCPAVFLYRQFTELILKQLIASATTLARLDGNNPAIKPLNHHDLDRLVSQLESVEPEGAEPFSEEVRNIIGQLNVFPADAFRYPVSKDGNPFFDPDSEFDIEYLAVQMEKLRREAVGLVNYYGALRDAIQDMLSYYTQDVLSYYSDFADY